jgi:hypothetical protein
MNKLCSGRFILTVVSALVFAYVSIRGVITSEAIAAILATVFSNYFNRGDRDVKHN